MTKKSKTSAEWQAEINVRCWKDPAFKKKLLVNPRKAVEELGLYLPEKAKVRVIEAARGEWVLPLISTPANASELSEKQLRDIQAAGDLGNDLTVGPPACPTA